MMKPNQYDKMLKKFTKQGMKTMVLWAKYEALRPEYEKASKKIVTLEGVEKFDKICKAMQKIQAKIEAIWKPHRRTIGACSKCGATRMPAVQGKKSGFGCFNSDCYHFETVGKKAS